MALADKNLVLERTAGLSGTQRIYRLGEYGLSLVNGPMLHAYPFAWEAAVLKYESTAADADFDLTYDTPLTGNVEVFETDDETNAFLDRAFKWFEENIE